LFRPRNLVNYGDPDLAALAAAYGFGLARNHPFIDGNKRTAFMVTELFLALNGQELIADDPSCVITMLRLAEGSLSETEFADWIRANTKPMEGG
jgi:death-on-curing protein